jgi:hypothetical protein
MPEEWRSGKHPSEMTDVELERFSWLVLTSTNYLVDVDEEVEVLDPCLVCDAPSLSPLCPDCN